MFGAQNQQERETRTQVICANGEGRVASWRVWIVCCAVCCSASTVRAQSDYEDLVTIQKTGSVGKQIIRCTILDYDANSIRILTPDVAAGGRYPSDEVTQVKTRQTAPHREAIELMRRGEIAAAGKKLDEAIKQESRPWVRREILAQHVRADLWNGNYVAAAIHFQAIVGSNAETRHYNLIPLVWSNRVVRESQLEPAYQLLGSEREVTRLCGASILLEHPSFGTLARNEMAELKRSSDPRVGDLAEAQLWRLKVRDREITVYDLPRWTQHIQSMPAELRGGPYFVLGEGYLIKLLREDGALKLLRVPILYDHDRQLAALATLDAATALQQHGRSRDAFALYRELAANYRDTPPAAEARSLLEQSAESVTGGAKQ